MIHCYKLGGLNIVLDVYSGSVHLVDEVAYDIIQMYENNPIEKITAAITDKYSDISAQDVKDCSHLQSELLILFCKSGQIPRRARNYEP